MALRRLTAREYGINLVMTVACWPVYARREWADRERLDAFALRRTREMAAHAARTVPVYADRYRDAGIDPVAIRTWDDVRRLPLMDEPPSTAESTFFAGSESKPSTEVRDVDEQPKRRVDN